MLNYLKIVLLTFSLSITPSCQDVPVNSNSSTQETLYFANVKDTITSKFNEKILLDSVWYLDENNNIEFNVNIINLTSNSELIYLSSSLPVQNINNIEYKLLSVKIIDQAVIEGFQVELVLTK